MGSVLASFASPVVRMGWDVHGSARVCQPGRPNGVGCARIGPRLPARSSEWASGASDRRLACSLGRLEGEPYADSMVDLRPWRVPVAVILLLAMAVRVGVSLAGILGASAGSSGMLTALAGGSVGAGEIFLCVALAAVCWWCADDGVRGAHGLALTAFVLVSAQIVLSVVATLAMVPLMAGADLKIVSLLIQLIWLVVPILAAAVLLRCARASRGGRRHPEPTPPPAALPPAETDLLAAEPEEAEPLYGEPAGWAPDEAAGAAWTSAGEAAKGGSAAGWGSGSATSWEPADWSADTKPPDAGDSAPPDQAQPNRG
jgi:hypothetical protein